jgi:outer membrane protein OmpA-like peptidoglycan-associated protein
VLVVAASMGCGQTSALRGRIAATEAMLRQAENNGAYRCAPRELALGRAHAHFASVELDEGNYARAQEHFDEAEPNAQAALRLSPAERCAPRGVVVERPPEPETPPPPPPPGDRDGDGFIDPQDQCPDNPENYNAFRDDDGCPDEPDVDGDGLPDSTDRCVVDPEDRDAYQDDDGCPEPDNDADGILDTADRCVNDPEDRDGFQDEDGCPDPDNDQDTVVDTSDNCPNEAGPVDNNGCPPVFQHIQVTQHGVRFHVEFDFNRATLRPSATATLDEVVRFLNLPQNRTLRYEVGGHTDSRGSDRHNDRLSQARAESVRLYLIQHGIDPARLTARGYGERQPIESNRTEAGRQANRRVELNEIDPQGNLVR